MINLGRYNDLRIDRITSAGAFLSDDKGNEVLLPGKYLPQGARKDDHLRVFVYKDNEGRPIATTLTPLVTLNEFACLKVKEVNPKIGAFLDWGIEKDLLVPFNQMASKMEPGKWYTVYLYLDKLTNRLVASSKVSGFLEQEHIDLEEGQEVDLLITREADLGLNAIVNNKYRGLIYESEIYQDLIFGDRVKGYVTRIRPDKKIDLSLRKRGMENLEEGAEKIMQELKRHKGFLPLTDKSDPSDIQFQLEMSKKNFKRSLGTLYKKQLVRLEEDGIYLNKPNTFNKQ